MRGVFGIGGWVQMGAPVDAPALVLQDAAARDELESVHSLLELQQRRLGASKVRSVSED